MTARELIGKEIERQEQSVEVTAALVVFDSLIWERDVTFALEPMICTPPQMGGFTPMSKIVGMKIDLLDGISDLIRALVEERRRTSFDAWQPWVDGSWRPDEDVKHILHVWPNVTWEWDDRLKILRGTAERGPNVQTVSGIEIDLGGWVYTKDGPPR